MIGNRFQIEVPAKFRRAVELHIAANCLVNRTQASLILGIFGPPGEGKTFQTEKICNELGLDTTVVSPAELENANAGQPGQLLRKIYRAASDEMSRSGRQAVILINDIDTVLGDWGALVQYTVNRQVVLGQLMALCDNPYEVSGKSTERIPLIVTGNNPSILYGPLTRPGRMRVFEWSPTPEERILAIRPLFNWLGDEEIRDLSEEFPEKPISFWSDVHTRLSEYHLSTKHGLTTGAISARLASRAKLELNLSSTTFERIHEIANQLRSEKTRELSYIS